jgi:hypothetical protein
MSKYDGMTLNERLVVSGELLAFEDATRRLDRNAMIEILGRVELPRESATEIVETILANRANYGL